MRKFVIHENITLIINVIKKHTIINTFMLTDDLLKSLLTPIAKINGKPINKKLPTAKSKLFSF